MLVMAILCYFLWLVACSMWHAALTPPLHQKDDLKELPKQYSRARIESV